jgi:hypothetical protein
VSRIQIWKVQQSGALSAVPLQVVRNSETERMLEDVLVGTPDLLEQDLTLVGRQLPTAGGPLDLLGVDPDGRLVVFELKRGVLTRDAVAQVIDYASDIAAMDREALARLIEEHSGRGGIRKIPEFGEWYAREYPTGAESLSLRPRMVLVGLGVDDRALRMVNFLAETGLPVQLLTFQAFQSDGALLLAKQVESEPVSKSSPAPGYGTKEGNRRLLMEHANELGVASFLEEVGKFIQDRLTNAYVWPHKGSISYNVNDETPEGRPTQRYIASLAPNEQQRGTLRLSFPERALELGADLDKRLTERLGGKRVESSSRAMDVVLRPENWAAMSTILGEALEVMRERWERRRQKLAATVIDLDEPVDSGAGENTAVPGTDVASASLENL